jgi:hypothetical protein
MQLKAEIKTFVVIASLLLSCSAMAIDSCIQKPKRGGPCPHLIYKLMKLKPDKPAKITCVCLVDFEKFLVEPKDDTEAAMRRLELKGLAADLQLTEEQVANLAKR